MTKHDRPLKYAAGPGGIEQLVALAAHDPKFRERLFADRLKAAKKARVRLTESEQMLLGAIPDEQLATTIDNATPARPARRGFLQVAAGLVGALSGGAALGGCKDAPGPVGGARPDEPAPATDGIRPDVPQEASEGDRPDVPPLGTAASRARGEEPQPPKESEEDETDGPE